MNDLKMPERILAKPDEQHKLNLHGEWYHQGGVVSSMTDEEIHQLALVEYIRADIAPKVDVEALKRERAKILSVAAGLVRSKPLEPEDIPTADRVMSEACITLRMIFDEIGRILTKRLGDGS